MTGSSQRVRGRPDSTLEQTGFELVVPPSVGHASRGESSSLLEEGPRVRIRLPPAGSPSLQCTAELRAKSPALSRRLIHGWRRETGWAERKPALSDVFSLTGIDAVSPWGSVDHVQ
jgi:hypothetical protein